MGANMLFVVVLFITKVAILLVHVLKFVFESDIQISEGIIVI